MFHNPFDLDGEMMWQNDPETAMFLTDTSDGLVFTMVLGHDRLEVTLTYTQAGRLMDRLSDALVRSTFEGRWEVTK